MFGLLNRLLRWPVASLLFAAVLADVGKLQYERDVHGEMVWDYIAPAETVLHSINYPAAVFTSLTNEYHSFRIGLEYSIPTFVLYLFAVAALWLAVGFRNELAQRLTRQRTGFILLTIILLLYSVIMISVALLSWDSSPLLMGLASIVWSVLFISFPVRVVIRRRIG